MATATLLVILSALLLTALLLRQALNPETTPALSLGDVLRRNLVMTRVTLSVLLVVAWPFVLHGLAGFLKLHFKRPNRFLALVALFLGGLTFVMTFLPGTGAATSLLAPTVLSLFLFRGLLRMGWGQAARLWAAQLAVLCIVMGVAVWGLESVAAKRLLNPARELPLIYQLAHAPATEVQRRSFVSNGRTFPVLEWASSGSDWIDRRANQAQVFVTSSGESEERDISLSDTQQNRILDQSRQNRGPWRSVRFTPEPGHTYVVTIESGARAEDELLIFSLRSINSE